MIEKYEGSWSDETWILTDLTKLDKLFTLPGLIDRLKEVTSDRGNWSEDWLRGRLWGQHWGTGQGEGLASRIRNTRIIVSELQQNNIWRGQCSSIVINDYWVLNKSIWQSTNICTSRRTNVQLLVDTGPEITSRTQDHWRCTQCPPCWARLARTGCYWTPTGWQASRNRSGPFPSQAPYEDLAPA